MTTSVEDYQSAELTPEQAQELVKGGKLDLLEVVTKNLFDGRTHVRRNASLVLRVAGEAPAEKAALVRVAVKDADPVVRENSAHAIAELDLNPGEVLGVLLEAVVDPVETVRSAARAALARLAERAGDGLLAPLVEALAKPDPAMREAAEERLLAYGEAAGTALVEALTHDNMAVSQAARETLERAPNESATALVNALNDPDRRSAAAAIVSTYYEIPESTRAELDGLAESEDESVASVAKVVAEAIDKNEPPPEPPGPIEVDGFYDDVLDDASLDAAAEGDLYLPSLVKALGDGRAPARANAAALSGRRAGQVDELERTRLAFAVGALVRDGDPVVRRAAATALGPIDDRNAVGPALVAVADSDVEVADAARASLATMASTQAAPLLESLTYRQPGLCRLAALDALVAAGAGIVDAIAGVLAESPNALAREMAAAALERAGEPARGATETLVQALDDPIDAVRRAAASALGFVAEATDPVLEALQARAKGDGTLEVRIAASTARARLTGTYTPPPESAEPNPIEVEGFEERLLTSQEIGAASDVTVERLVAALADGRAAVRHNAALALGARGEGAADTAPALVLAARDSDRAVRRAVSTALGQLGAKVADLSVPVLASALADPDPEVAGAAGEALESLGDGAISGLVASLDVYADLAERSVIPTLVARGKKAVKPLGDVLGSDSPAVRANAARALGAIGPDAASAVEALTERLTDPSDDVRRDVANALGRLGVDKQPVLDALKAMRKDHAAAVRSAAAQAYDRLTGALEERVELAPIDIKGFDEAMLSADELAKGAKAIGVERLTKALNDGRPVVRHNAAVALTTLGKKAEDAALALAVASKDGTPEVRRAAVNALAALGGGVADYTVGSLLRALHDGDREVREGADTALVGLGPDAIPGLVEALDRDPGDARETVLPYLIALGDQVIGPLTECLEALSFHVRLNAVAALGLLGPDHAAAAGAALEKAIQNDNGDVRLAAKRALAKMRAAPGPNTLEPTELPEGFETDEMDMAAIQKAAKGLDGALLAKLAFDGRHVVRANAARAFATLGKKAAEHLDALLLVLKDSVPAVRLAAIEALGELKVEPERAVPALAAVLSTTEDHDIQQSVLSAIDSYGKAAVDPLIDELSKPSRYVLATVGPIAAHVPKLFVGPVTDHLKPEHIHTVRENAADLLAVMGREARSAQKALLEALEDRDPVFRRKVILAIGRCAKDDMELRRLLRKVALDNTIVATDTGFARSSMIVRNEAIVEAVDEAIMWLQQ